MRAVVQRVAQASVVTDGQEIARIGKGLAALLGIGQADTAEDGEYIARKIAGLRVFEDSAGKMNLDLAETGGSVLIVPQFTLYGDCRKGRRPSFAMAAPPGKAEKLYKKVVETLSKRGHEPQTGRFGAHMKVSLVNDGPVTLLLDSQE